MMTHTMNNACIVHTRFLFSVTISYAFGFVHEIAYHNKKKPNNHSVKIIKGSKKEKSAYLNKI